MSRQFRASGAAACAVASLAAFAPRAAAGGAAFFGSWSAPDRDGRGITRIDVRRSGERVLVRVWGGCDPALQACAGGAPPAPELNLGGEHTLLLLRASDDRLSYQSFTSFADGGGDYDVGAWLAR